MDILFTDEPIAVIDTMIISILISRKNDAHTNMANILSLKRIGERGYIFVLLLAIYLETFI